MYILIPRTKTMQRETVWDAVNKLRWAPEQVSGNTPEGKKLETEESIPGETWQQKTDHKMQTSVMCQ